MAAPSKQFRWSWRSAKFRALVYQVLAVLLVVAAGWYLVHNTLANMRARGIQSGFDFLSQPAGFAISESLFEFDPQPMEGIKKYLDLVSEQWNQALSRLKAFVEG